MTLRADTFEQRATEIRQLVREAFGRCQIASDLAAWRSSPLATERECGVYVRTPRRNFDRGDVHWDFACRQLARFVASQEVSFIIDTITPHAKAEGRSIDASQPDLSVLGSAVDQLRAAGDNPSVAVVPIALMFPVLWQLRPVGDVVETPSGSEIKLIWDHDCAPDRILMYDPAAVGWHALTMELERVNVDCSKEGATAVRVAASTELSAEVLDTSSVWSLAVTGEPLSIEGYRQAAEGV